MDRSSPCGIPSAQRRDSPFRRLRRSGITWHVRVLAVTTEPLSAAQLREALPDGVDPADAEVMVVAPAVHESALRFWMSDADDAIARAEEVRQRTLARLSREGVPATADTGEASVEEAIEDALKTFEADRILVFTHPRADRRHGEGLDADAVQDRFRIPVTQARVAARG